MSSGGRVLKKCIRLTIPAGGAKPAPPVGPALGQAGLNIMQFCKDFNAKTANMKDEVPVPVVISAYSDKSFDYSIKTPPASYFLKKAAAVEKGASKPGHESVGSISLKHIHEIAKIKQKDDPRISLQSISRTLMGQARKTHHFCKMFWNRPNKNYKGTHVCITGGSDGLGFELAKIFVEEGARVSIVARKLVKLETARNSLEALATEKGHTTKIVAVSGDCSKRDSVEEAIQKAEAALGSVEVLVTNAGVAAPGRFVDTDVADFESQIQLNYLGTVYTVKAVIQNMIRNRAGEIVLISSALGVLGLTGYSAYAPTKWALRGFADCLRMEMQAYGVAVRIAYPPDMQTTGYEAELKRTPSEVGEISKASGNSVFPPQDVAKTIVRGMKRGLYHLPSPDYLQTLSQTAMSGLSPISLFLPFQVLVNCVCTLLFAYYVYLFDRITTRHAKKRDARD